ncbi:MAG TPA: cytochrome c maturation protein CcmE [Acidimicrobiales bacterium]|nr:cytochrome c maturation protein CcmE [Acidimicrobiales bacterium]
MKRGYAAIFLSVAVAVAGLLLWQGLRNATVYFKTVDEAVAQRSSLGTRRFRLEGIVAPGSVHERDGGVDFVVEENNAEIHVHHVGDPPELFKASIPVVLEGHFAGATYESDRILVKHTAEYRKANPTRVKDYKS